MAQAKRKSKAETAPAPDADVVLEPPPPMPAPAATSSPPASSKKKRSRAPLEGESASAASIQHKTAAPEAAGPAAAVQGSVAVHESMEQEAQPDVMQQGHDREAETSEDPEQLGSGDGDGLTSSGAEEGNGLEGEKPKKKVLSEEKLKRLKEEYDRRGVVYVSRIPPHMKPMKLKQLLSQYGETLRVYCTPEDASARRMRKKKGGNTGKNFIEGWVEFADKRVAKRVALAINGQRIGGKKRSAYYDDLWCVKYLKHFKWDHLTEEINYQKAVREQRLAFEISAAKRERDHYLSQVDQSKALAAMAERRASKATPEQQEQKQKGTPGEGAQGGEEGGVGGRRGACGSGTAIWARNGRMWTQRRGAQRGERCRMMC